MLLIILRNYNPSFWRDFFNKETEKAKKTLKILKVSSTDRKDLQNKQKDWSRKKKEKGVDLSKRFQHSDYWEKKPIELLWVIPRRFINFFLFKFSIFV